VRRRRWLGMLDYYSQLIDQRLVLTRDWKYIVQFSTDKRPVVGRCCAGLLLDILRFVIGRRIFFGRVKMK